MSDDKTSRDKGLEIMEQLYGKVPKLSPQHEDIMQFTVDRIYGEIWSREGLSLPERSLITVSILAVLGHEWELKMHIKGALNIGIEEKKLREAIYHTAPYGGWPASINALHSLDDVLQKRKDKMKE